MSINFVSRRFNHQVAIVLCPEICCRFLHFSQEIDAKESWALRDYVSGMKIVRSNNPDAEELKEIKDKILLSLPDEYVLNENVERKAEWKNHLNQLSRDILYCPDTSEETPQTLESFWEPL